MSESPKKKKTASPTQRTLNRLRSMGFTVAVVERWNPHSMIRQDLFGFNDIMAVRGDNRILGVQATTTQHVLERLRKIMSIPAAKTWLKAGGAIEVWGWQRGGRKWFLTRKKVTLEDFVE